MFIEKTRKFAISKICTRTVAATGITLDSSIQVNNSYELEYVRGCHQVIVLCYSYLYLKRLLVHILIHGGGLRLIELM